MSTEIRGDAMTSTDTRHTARPLADGRWELSWLPGRAVSRNEAITGMALAEAVGSGLQVGDSRWPHLNSWAAELGLSGPEAVVRVTTSDEVREHIARAEAAEAASRVDAALEDAVAMTGPTETSAAGEAWSRRVDAAVFGMDETDWPSLDAWMQVHAESGAPHLHEAALVAVWEAREADAAEDTRVIDDDDVWS